MSLFRRLGFDRGDERSERIALYSGRVAWMFTSVVLLSWSLYSLLRTGSLSTEFAVFTASQVVFWVSHLLYSRRMGG